ncbi:MAG TPA: MFS transporter [Opitutaceae bacterium]|jgi:MFS family permease
MDETQTLYRNLRALPPTAWILFGGTFLNKFGTFVVPFLALYLTSRGFTFAQAGIAIGAYGVGNVFATIIGGHLADHIGRRKTIILSMFSGAATMMMLSQAASYPSILAASALCGLAGEFYRPASSALLADLVPAANRVTAYSAYRMAINAGFAFGPATAGFLAGRGYFWLFAGDAATSALFGLVAIFALPEVPHPPENRGSWLEASRTLLADRRLLRVLLAALGIALVFFQMNCTFGLAVTGAGLSLREYGLLLSMNGAMVVLIELPLTTITTRHPPLSVIALGYLVIGIGFALTAFASTLAAFAACIAIFTFGEMAAMPVTSAYVAGLSPRHMRGRYMGAYGLTWTVAQVVGPGLGMALFSRSAPVYWAACGAIGIASAALAARASAISAAPEAAPSAAGK